jgi:murein DD-endopeptidase MepM/ murein hydrolase activator NlpD
MIENKQLYSYHVDEQPMESLSSEANQAEDARLQAKFDQLLARGIVCVLTFLMLVFISKSHLAWARRAKTYLHTAIHATSRQTFGRFAGSPLVAQVLKNSRNMLHPETFTRKWLEEPAITVESRSAERWVWPVRGKLIKRFGLSIDPENQNQFSQGIEISALPGEKIAAVGAGAVESVTQNPDLGWRVAINHRGGRRSVYQNLGYVYVESGQYVDTGAPIAKMKLSGLAGDSVLRFEFWEDGKPVDPLYMFAVR